MILLPLFGVAMDPKVLKFFFSIRKISRTCWHDQNNIVTAHTNKDFKYWMYNNKNWMFFYPLSTMSLFFTFSLVAYPPYITLSLFFGFHLFSLRHLSKIVEDLKSCFFCQKSLDRFYLVPYYKNGSRLLGHIVQLYY